MLLFNFEIMDYEDKYQELEQYLRAGGETGACWDSMLRSLHILTHKLYHKGYKKCL